MRKLISYVLLIALSTIALPAQAAEEITCWFPPDWKLRTAQADRIARTLGEDSGLKVHSRVAESYPEILEAFAKKKPSLVYVGSFVQAILAARKLGKPLVQTVDGRQMYAGVLVTMAGTDAKEILALHPERIAYTIGTSSGESSARAATGGKASIGVRSHSEAVTAVLQGWAEGAFVKDWWWEANRAQYPGLEMHLVPGVSIQMNPDNVLTASNSVSLRDRERIRTAAMAHPEVFGRNSSMQNFTPGQLAFPLGLMRKGGLDPLVYSW